MWVIFISLTLADERITMPETAKDLPLLQGPTIVRLNSENEKSLTTKCSLSPVTFTEQCQNLRGIRKIKRCGHGVF